ncbi:MAG TPA: hypothetical protein VFN22_12625 [Gemmatimonadales bacterium]|nr:hypothetical protein [Gemmatimonadales bacterium]
MSRVLLVSLAFAAACGGPTLPETPDVQVRFIYGELAPSTRVEYKSVVEIQNNSSAAIVAPRCGGIKLQVERPDREDWGTVGGNTSCIGPIPGASDIRVEPGATIRLFYDQPRVAGRLRAEVSFGFVGGDRVFVAVSEVHVRATP